MVTSLPSTCTGLSSSWAGYEVVWVALVDQAEAFSGQGHIAILDPIFKGTGVFVASGKSWKALWCFSLATMKDFGMGKRSIEERIKEEARCLVEELQKTQEKFQAESDRVIGTQLLPAPEDGAKMPYTDAVIHKIQRFSDITPCGLPHSGTTVYPILSPATLWHPDPCHFEKPDVFSPGHFLDPQGNFRKQDETACLGETLARSKLFLFLTVLQSFSLGSPKPLQDINLTPRTNGQGRLPPVVQVSFLPCREPRQEMQIPSESSNPAPISTQNS
uniref:Uncharacterized protein n=1 Tax=Sus scrofa TaxID=9823 RepID=A0A8D1IW11_PIG